MTSVYVIAAEGGPVKIGIANDPRARLAQFRTGTPYPLRLAHVEDVGELAAAKVEKAAHALLAAAHVHGEWFKVTADEARSAVLEAMERLRNPPPPPPVAEPIIYLRQTEPILPVQCKMARAALGFGIRELAFASDTSTDTILRFERGEGLRRRTVEAIRAALEAAGVEFIPENGGGAGVRLRKERPTSSPEVP